MKKALFFTLLSFTFIIIGCRLNKSDKSKKIAKKPNIIYLIADQLRYDAVGYSGNKKAQTPNLDLLSSQSLNFKNTVSVTPVCSAYRSSLWTGKYTSSTGMVINELRLNPNQKSIAHVLGENAYETCYIGKWHLYSNCSDHNAVECAYIPPGEHRLGFNSEWKAFNFHHDNYGSFYFEDEPKKLPYDKPYEPEAQFDMAMRYLDEVAQKNVPFVMALSIGLPHDPWDYDNVPDKNLKKFKNTKFFLPENWSDAPDPYMDRETNPERWINYWKANIPEFKRVYYAMVNNLDDNVGRLMKKLDDLGLSDDTIFIFSSDHGEMFGENGRVFKLSFYDSAARVPFLIRWPKKIKPGISDVLLNTPDVMPTLLSLAGLKNKIPETVEGMDLSSICLGQGGEEPEYAFMQGMGHTWQWKDGYEWRAVRDKQFTYARYLVDGKELLFDNIKDPMQNENVIDDNQYQETALRLRNLMKKKMEELNDEFKPCTWYRDNWVDDNRFVIKSAKGDF